MSKKKYRAPKAKQVTQPTFPAGGPVPRTLINAKSPLPPLPPMEPQPVPSKGQPAPTVGREQPIGEQVKEIDQIALAQHVVTRQAEIEEELSQIPQYIDEIARLTNLNEYLLAENKELRGRIGEATECLRIKAPVKKQP